MSTLTAIVLSGFVAYAIGWYSGRIEGSFALLLFLATVVSGVYWLAPELIREAETKIAQLEDAKLNDDTDA